MINELKSSTGGCSFYILARRKHRKQVLDRCTVPQREVWLITDQVFKSFKKNRDDAVEDWHFFIQENVDEAQSEVHELMFSFLDLAYL